MKKTTAIFFSFAALVAGLVLFTACEVSSTDDSRGVSVSPSSAHLSAGQSVVLTASGGWNYKWELSSSGLGYLSSSGGSQVTYMAKGGDGIQRITVSADGSSSGTSSTNATASSGSSFATALIYQGN